MKCTSLGVICMLFGANSLANAAPSINDLQDAFDREASVAGGFHDKDLKIVGVDCQPDGQRKFVCQVGFVKTAERSDRVYIDAASIERTADGNWKLLRGLCRRLL